MGTTASRRDVLILALICLLIGGLMGAILGASTTAGAADGDTLTIGRKNYANHVTQIKGKGGVKFWNTTKTGEPAAWFEVVSGPPFAVNSIARVANLNADMVDNRNSDQLMSGWEGCSNDNIPAGTNWACTETILTPRSGGLLLSGSVDFRYTGATNERVWCRFYVDDVLIAASDRDVMVGPGEFGTCASTAFIAKPAGTYVIKFTLAGVDPATEPGEGAWWVVYVPD